MGWFGWSIVRDISHDGHKIAFEEEGNGGGPNYTVFLRDTDGSPPARIGEGQPLAISPDTKWVVTKSAKGGPLSMVPTGAGESRQLTHDAISYGSARFLPDGKRLLASGVESGHGARDYLIDLNSGDSKPITPEGVSGVRCCRTAAARPCWGPTENGNLAARRKRHSSDSRPGGEILCHRLVAGREVGVRGLQPQSADCQGQQGRRGNWENGAVGKLTASLWAPE